MTASHAPAAEASQGPDYLYIASQARRAAVPALLITVFALLEPNFLSPFNLLNVLRQVSFAGLIAIGMTFVILTAGIDLSVGALLALAGMVGAYVAKGGLADRFADRRQASTPAIRPTWPCSRRWPSASPVVPRRGS